MDGPGGGTGPPNAGRIGDAQPALAPGPRGPPGSLVAGRGASRDRGARAGPRAAEAVTTLPRTPSRGRPLAAPHDGSRRRVPAVRRRLEPGADRARVARVLTVRR